MLPSHKYPHTVAGTQPCHQAPVAAVETTSPLVMMLHQSAAKHMQTQPHHLAVLVNPQVSQNTLSVHPHVHTLLVPGQGCLHGSNSHKLLDTKGWSRWWSKCPAGTAACTRQATQQAYCQ